jgi:hypothetical protein
MDAYHLILFTHAGLGVAALASFWTAALAKKGSRPHKLAGKVYVLLITGNALWRAWTAVRRKRDFASYADATFRRLGWANIVGGASMLGIGAATAEPVLLGFSAVGIVGGRSMLLLAERGPAHPRWWLQEHLNAMLGCGVATHIAFLLIGLPRVLPAAWNGPALATFGWLAPLLVAAVAGRLLGRKYLPAPLQSARTISPVSTLRREALAGAASQARTASK